LKKTFIIVLTSIIVLVLLITIIVYINTNNSAYLDNIKYDVLIAEHRYEYEDVDDSMIPEGGYSTNYYYIVINSDKLEKYTVRYSDIWDVHNERGDIDTISIKKETINKIELESAIKKYGKTNKKNKLKELLDNNIKEKYVTKIDNQ